jgi:hypothetical protein
VVQTFEAVSKSPGPPSRGKRLTAETRGHADGDAPILSVILLCRVAEGIALTGLKIALTRLK